VYQQWCGSCKALENVFKKIKMEQQTDLLKFALVILTISFNYKRANKKNRDLTLS
jgi:hypothetical protein